MKTYFFVAPLLINTSSKNDASFLLMCVGVDGIARMIGVYRDVESALAAAKSLEDSK